MGFGRQGVTVNLKESRRNPGFFGLDKLVSTHFIFGGFVVGFFALSDTPDFRHFLHLPWRGYGQRRLTRPGAFWRVLAVFFAGNVSAWAQDKPRGVY